MKLRSAIIVLFVLFVVGCGSSQDGGRPDQMHKPCAFSSLSEAKLNQLIEVTLTEAKEKRLNVYYNDCREQLVTATMLFVFNADTSAPELDIGEAVESGELGKLIMEMTNLSTCEYVEVPKEKVNEFVQCKGGEDEN